MSTPDSLALTPGETCYDLHGNEYEYFTHIGGFDFAYPIYDSPEETIRGEPEKINGKLYRDAPVQRQQRDVTALQDEIKSLKSARDELRAEIRKANNDFAETLQRLKDCPELENIDRFLAGEITHFVIDNDSSTSIQTFEEAITYTDDRKSYQRLLSLYGDAKRKPVWGIARYGDGSGSHLTYCIPCASLEEAQEKAAAMHADKLVDLSKKYGLDNYWHVFSNWFSSAEKLGMDIPSDLAEIRHAKRLASTESSLAQRKAQLEQAKVNLDEAQKEYDEYVGVSHV